MAKKSSVVRPSVTKATKAAAAAAKPPGKPDTAAKRAEIRQRFK